MESAAHFLEYIFHSSSTWAYKLSVCANAIVSISTDCILNIHNFFRRSLFLSLLLSLFLSETLFNKVFHNI